MRRLIHEDAKRQKNSNMNDYQNKIKKFAGLIRNNKTVFLTGAGASTESGIPDFRGQNGLYKQNESAEDILSSYCLKYDTEKFYDFLRKNMDLRSFKPNSGHIAVAALEEAGFAAGVVTQNIDGLHQKAGSKKVIELHGTLGGAYCNKCHTAFSPNIIFDSKESMLICPICKRGKIRPAITLYGEGLPEGAYDAASELISSANLLVVCGTSLKVNTARSLVYYYFGKYLVFINETETEFDQYADIIFRERFGSVMGDVAKELLMQN